MLFLLACTVEPAVEEPLRLRWLRGYPGETWAEAEEGFWWALSDLGAIPARDTLEVVDERSDVVVFDLWLSRLGLGEAAVTALAPVAGELGGSAEAAEFGAVDLGRFLLRSLYEPWRYYAITGACVSRPSVPDAAQYAVTTSLLVTGERLVEYRAEPRSVSDILFVAGEGEGSLLDGTFVASEHEVVSVMANGQFRYSIYDDSGTLAPHATVGPAGQPGKCRWCHEYRLQTGTPENQSAPGYVDYAGWIDDVEVATAVVGEARDQVLVVAWPGVEAHDRAEWLAESFMFPDAERVALEYGRVDLDGLPTTDLTEYGWVDRYQRADVDARWGGEAVPVVADTRDGSEGYAEAEVGGCE